MRYIKNLFKILILFSLTTVLCQGCRCSSNTKKQYKKVSQKPDKYHFHNDKSPTESPKVESLIQQPVISTAQTESPDNDDNDENNEKPQINPLEEPFMPNLSGSLNSTDSTESEYSNKEEIKKIFETAREKTINQYKTQLRRQNEVRSPQQKLSEDQIQELIQLQRDDLDAINKKRLEFPFKQAKALADSTQDQLNHVEDINEIGNNLSDLCTQYDKSIRITK